MTKFQVFYYDVPMGIIYAVDAKAATVAVGVRFGGQAGMWVRVAS